MEQWEKEYIDAVVKSKQAMGQGKTIHHSYEEGYDSSRWIEMEKPDGTKYYVPKEKAFDHQKQRTQKTLRIIIRIKWKSFLKGMAVILLGFVLLGNYLSNSGIQKKHIAEWRQEIRPVYLQGFIQGKILGGTYINGYHPWMYYPVWYVGQSVAFWKQFLMNEDPDVEIVLENVLETQPDMILDILEGVDNPRLRMCFDVGHINAYSYIPIMDWLETCAPWIGHIHVNNNDGREDLHQGLQHGNIPMRDLLQRIESLCPEVTITLEMTETKSSLEWLKKERLWRL